jgi:hypothetical protein
MQRAQSSPLLTIFGMLPLTLTHFTDDIPTGVNVDKAVTLYPYRFLGISALQLQPCPVWSKSSGTLRDTRNSGGPYKEGLIDFELPRSDNNALVS